MHTQSQSNTHNTIACVQINHFCNYLVLNFFNSNFQLNVSETHSTVLLHTGWDLSEFNLIVHTPIKESGDYCTLIDILCSGQSVHGDHMNVLVAVKNVSIRHDASLFFGRRGYMLWRRSPRTGAGERFLWRAFWNSMTNLAGRINTRQTWRMISKVKHLRKQIVKHLEDHLPFAKYLITRILKTA